MINYDELEKLNDLRLRGVISEEEFRREKERIFNRTEKSTMSTLDINQYCLFIHLSQLLVFFMGIGLIVPIILWLMKKDESPIIDRHGKTVTNWILSLAVYSVAGGVLCCLLIGVPILIALGICNIIFIILGSTKAYSGELWKYPLSIEFLK